MSEQEEVLIGIMSVSGPVVKIHDGEGSVNSVNGKVGDVVLTSEDVGALPIGYHDETKQDTINDLDRIRSGAVLGTTAVQPATLEYELNKKADKTALEGLATQQWVEDQGYLTEHQDISGKQDKLTLETDVKAFIDKTYIESLLDNLDEVSY